MIFPFWMTQEITQEPVVFFEEQGKLRGSLLFHPNRLNFIEIWDESYEKFTPHLVESIDIEVKENVLLIDAKIKDMPRFHANALIKEKFSSEGYPATRDGTHWLLFSETGLFHRMQVRMSYTHEETWMGFVPTSSPNKVLSTKQKLANGEPLDIFVFGDSISTGANCSKSLNLSPHSASYPELFVQIVHETFPNSYIRLKNESVGGQTSEWGARQLPKILKQAGDFHFDLNVIAWGMNDASGRRPFKRFLKNINNQIKVIRRTNPAAEFILVGSSLPNDAWSGAQPEFLFSYMEGLQELVRTSGPEVEFANLTLLWRDLLTRKNYYDLTGNGLNHPNDFGHLIYSQALAAAIDLYSNKMKKGS